MEIEIYWSQNAEDLLIDIFQYFNEKASLKIANRIINEIVDSTINLEKFPEMGQIEPLLLHRPQHFRYLVVGNYKIIYWINRIFPRVEIATIFDCRQNPEKMNDFI